MLYEDILAAVFRDVEPTPEQRAHAFHVVTITMCRAHDLLVDVAHNARQRGTPDAGDAAEACALYLDAAFDIDPEPYLEKR